jgi:hypothetical protein
VFTPVKFPSQVESLVRFVEDTDPATMVDESLAKLRAGTPIEELVTASALAIVRSTELPPQHHGGPIHPICGVRAVLSTSRRLAGELAYLPVIQHLALCNNHVHSPSMGPYMMLEMEPLPGSALGSGSYHLSDEMFHGEPPATAAESLSVDPVQVTRDAFVQTLNARQAPAAEHHFLWLLERLSPGEALDQLLPLALAGNDLDDHNFLYPVFTARALDHIGWQWAKVLMRPAVRYQARTRAGLRVQSRYSFEHVEAIMDEHKLLERDIAQHSSEAETEAIGALGHRLGAARDYSDNVVVMAEALADGMSLEGAGEALSFGGALAYLSTSYGNPMDSHLHTGANARRYLLGLDGVSKRHRILALLTGFTGPEVLLAESLLNWESNVEASIARDLPHRDEGALLDAITESIEAQPWVDWRGIGVSRVVAPDEVKQTVALARQYADLGYSSTAYFERMAEFACRDDFTEMHALKHFQAIAEEYEATRAPFRWAHLVSAAKSAAVVYVGQEHRIYRDMRGRLVA